MKKLFNKSFVAANCGYYSAAELAGFSFMKKEGEVSLAAILDSEIGVEDKFFFVCKKVADKEENQQLAIRVAEIILPIYESKYAADGRPRQVIQAAKDYLSKKITKQQLLDAAAAANAAAYVADTASAAIVAIAVSAADAAVADVAADAAAAAYAAADAAATVVAYTAAEGQLLYILKNFCNCV